MSAAFWAAAITGFVWATLIAAVNWAAFSFSSRRLPAFAHYWLLAGIGDALFSAAAQVWPYVFGAVAAVACALLLLWRRWKDRRRVLRALGGKAWAILSALARRAREAAQPRPVLRPVPQGGAG